MRWILLLCIACINGIEAQNNEKRIKLSSELNEISGLTFLNDTVLIAINDSGNLPELFFLRTSGEVFKTTQITETQNIDWEDLAMDDSGYVYIADVGNNLNNRRDLCILKVSASEAFHKDSLPAQKIRFSYPDQIEFPPRNEELRYNCEAVFWFADALYLLTKNEAKEPREGGKQRDRKPRLYVIPDLPGNYTAQYTNWQAQELFDFKKRGLSDLITSATVENNRLYVLAYRHLFVSNWGTKPNNRALIYHKKFSSLKQREALAVAKDGTIYIGAEKHRLFGGPYLYIRKLDEP